MKHYFNEALIAWYISRNAISTPPISRAGIENSTLGPKGPRAEFSMPKYNNKIEISLI